jgi:hypothetical protein
MFGKCLPFVIGFMLTIYALNTAKAEEKGIQGEDIQEAITMFVGGSSRERVEAAENLANYKPKELISFDAWGPFTKVLMEDDSPHIQQTVIKALGVQGSNCTEFGKQKITVVLIGTIKNESLHSVVRAEAVSIIGRLMLNSSGQRDLIGSYLEKQLDTKDTILLKTIMTTLSLWDWDLGPRLWENVVNDDPDIRRATIRTLKRQIVSDNLKIDNVKAKGFLDIINNEQKNSELRIDLVNLMAFAVKNGSKITNFTRTLGRVIKSKGDRQVTLAVVYAIGGTSDPNLIKLLLKVFEVYKRSQEQEGVMIYSAACASAGDFISLPGKYKGYFIRYKKDFEGLTNMLVEAMKSNNILVRKEAAYALGNITSKKIDRSEAVAALIEAVADPDESQSGIVLDSLKFLTQQDFGQDLEAWRTWYRTNQKDLAAK